LGSQKDVVKLFRSADCNLSLGKAEGFGLSGLESLSCGLHNIITNYSGHQEYANSENSLLIEMDELEPAYDGFWFKGDIGNWATFGDRQMEQLIEYMRFIHKKKQNGELGINEEGIKTSKQFSWANAAKKLTDFIQELGG
jgi:glycosyltransferase involved in cell wall biosynthesis